MYKITMITNAANGRKILQKILNTCYLRNAHNELIWVKKVFKNGPSKICGGQPLRNTNNYKDYSKDFQSLFDGNKK